MIDATDRLHNVLAAYSNIPMSLNEEQLNDFIKLLEKMLLKTDLSATDELTLIFMNTLYNIDFSLMLKNNMNKSLIEKLLNFGINFTTHFDLDLQQQCKGNLACLNAYNVISAYKFYIRGFLNEVNLYKHFNHFYFS